ncbi:hypothetical protein T439DRAFT_334327 [Meredithblackwellia eburnea MCA 4105]
MTSPKLHFPSPATSFSTKFFSIATSAENSSPLTSSHLPSCGTGLELGMIEMGSQPWHPPHTQTPHANTSTSVIHQIKYPTLLARPSPSHTSPEPTSTPLERSFSQASSSVSSSSSEIFESSSNSRKEWRRFLRDESEDSSVESEDEEEEEEKVVFGADLASQARVGGATAGSSSSANPYDQEENEEEISSDDEPLSIRYPSSSPVASRKPSLVMQPSLKIKISWDNNSVKIAPCYQVPDVSPEHETNSGTEETESGTLQGDGEDMETEPEMDQDRPVTVEGEVHALRNDVMAPMAEEKLVEKTFDKVSSTLAADPVAAAVPTPAPKTPALPSTTACDPLHSPRSSFHLPGPAKSFTSDTSVPSTSSINSLPQVRRRRPPLIPLPVQLSPDEFNALFDTDDQYTGEDAEEIKNQMGRSVKRRAFCPDFSDEDEEREWEDKRRKRKVARRKEWEKANGVEARDVNLRRSRRGMGSVGDEEVEAGESVEHFEEELSLQIKEEGTTRRLRTRPVSSTPERKGRTKVSKVKKMLSPVKEGNEYSDDEKEEGSVYCVCDGRFDGPMIQCDSKDCLLEWFHIGCTTLEHTPSSKDKWICHLCTIDKEVGRRGEKLAVRRARWQKMLPGKHSLFNS